MFKYTEQISHEASCRCRETDDHILLYKLKKKKFIAAEHFTCHNMALFLMLLMV